MLLAIRRQTGMQLKTYQSMRAKLENEKAPMTKGWAVDPRALGYFSLLSKHQVELFARLEMLLSSIDQDISQWK